MYKNECKYTEKNPDFQIPAMLFASNPLFFVRICQNSNPSLKPVHQCLDSSHWFAAASVCPFQIKNGAKIIDLGPNLADIYHCYHLRILQ